MNKKVITILPYKIDEGAKSQSINYIYQTYLNKLVGLNLLPILCSSSFTQEMILELYNEADGVLLLGGGDIDPELYSQKPHEKTKVVNPLRDESETFLIKLAMRDKKPLLGVCRGMQIVNSVLGGTLYQHVPDVVQSEEHNVAVENPSYDDVASDRGQYMNVLEETFLSKLVGSGRKLVHCAHHQAINGVASDLKINAKSDTGVIEGLEGFNLDNHFIMLLQNHIETQNNDFSNSIWRAFSESL